MIHHNCQVERVKQVQRGHFDAVTGKTVIDSITTEHTACDTPLFGFNERKTGVCTSCLGGWSVEGNAPTHKGRRQIQTAKKALA